MNSCNISSGLNQTQSVYVSLGDRLSLGAVVCGWSRVLLTDVLEFDFNKGVREGEGVFSCCDPTTQTRIDLNIPTDLGKNLFCLRRLQATVLAGPSVCSALDSGEPCP